MRGLVIGRNSRQKLERAVELRRAMTPAEHRLWQKLRANRLENLHFRRQAVIEGFIVDFYCHARRLAVEVDGTGHLHTREYDAERDAVLEDLGIRVLRVTNKAVETDLHEVLVSILAAANDAHPAARVARGTPPGTGGASGP